MSNDKTALLPSVTAPVTEAAKEKKYTIVTKENKTYSVKAHSVAWTENADFILLMNGDVTKHVIVAANVVAVTED